MALIKCPECGKDVSDTAYQCPNCSYVINEPKRGITGKIFKAIFMIFNSIMILSIIILIFQSSQIDDSGVTASVSVATLIMIWLFIGLPLGIMSYITRAKSK